MPYPLWVSLETQLYPPTHIPTHKRALTQGIAPYQRSQIQDIGRIQTHDTPPMGELENTAENTVGKQTNTAQPSCGEALEQINSARLPPMSEHRYKIQPPIGERKYHHVGPLWTSCIHVEPFYGQALIGGVGSNERARTHGTYLSRANFLYILGILGISCLSPACLISRLLCPDFFFLVLDRF